MKYMAGIIVSMFSLTAEAQYTVKILITGLPPLPVTQTLYICGSFNGWNPRDENFQLQKNTDGQFYIVMKNIKAAPYEFKFTRGDWNRAETNEEGVDITNRKFVLKSDSVLQCVIAGWKDGFTQKEKPSTASAQVSILDTAFSMPQLGRTRRIWIYLPKGYTVAAEKRYPVMYMHDGQNLFDNATSFAGEWGIDEAMDTLHHPCIIVGIDNGSVRRMNEYNPHNTKQFGKGEGKAYLAFIVEQLKPYIDKKYRTLPDQQHTYMAGSSMGGLISFYAGLYYPGIFGVLGVFSPSFWITPQVKQEIKELAGARHGAQQYYFYAGGLESAGMATDMEAVAAEMKKAAHPRRLVTVLNPEGRHNEASWRAVFPSFYKFIVRSS